MQNVFYAELSAVVGLSQVVDAVFLYRSRGAISKWLVAFSFFEYFWAAVSFAALVAGPPRWLPLSFMVYVVGGVLYGISLSNQGASAGGTNKGIPVWFAVFGGLFGLYFMAASIYVSVRA